jgi:O-acetyl-ADP-ribose deacetylase (regulator of RNase III)
MQIIQGNILEITEGIICHQVNCKGVFGAGLAQQIREKYPTVYQKYIDWYNLDYWGLGVLQIVAVSPKLRICNLAGQYAYGRNKQYTNYEALTTGLRTLSSLVGRCNSQVYLPYKMGCGLGGGNWDVVSGIIEETLPDAIIVKL